MKCNSPIDGRCGTTILEVVIVFFVLLFLAAMMLPTTRNAREPARRAQCANNLKQIGLALHAYVDQQNILPPAIIYSPDSSDTPKGLSLGTTGWLLLLPFVDKQGMYDQYDFNQGAVPGSIGPSLVNQTITGTRMTVYTCPSDQNPSLASNDTAPGMCVKASTSNYLFGAGSNLNPRDTHSNPHVPYNESAPSYGKLFELKSTSMGIFGHNGSARFDQIKDGLGCTIAAGETLQVHAGGDRAAVVWGQGKLYGQMAVVDGYGLSTPKYRYPPASTTTMKYPRLNDGKSNVPVNPAVLASAHANGANILFMDGSVRFVNQIISADIYNSLFMIQDGLKIPDNF